MNFNFLKKLVFICTLVLLLDIFLQYELYLQQHHSKISTVTSQLSEIRADLGSSITHDLLLVQGVVNFFSVNPTLSAANFNRLAQVTMQNHNHIRHLSVAQDYVIRYVYPLTGKESLLGLDYRTIPDRWEQVKNVGQSSQMSIQGPMQLIQGDIGLIGRMPVLREDEENGERFWGLVSAVINIDSLLADLDEHPALTFALRSFHDQGNNGPAFFGNSALFSPDQKSITMTVSFPGGHWQLAGCPSEGWHSWQTPPPLALLIHGILLLFALALAYTTFRWEKKRSLLIETQHMLDEAQSLAHLGSWRININDKSVWWSRECYHIFGKDPATYTPTYADSLALMHPDDHDEIIKRLEATIESGVPYAFDHRLMHDDGTIHHVQGQAKRYDTKDKPSYIHGTLLDITKRKQTEIALKDSQNLNDAIGEASLDALITINSDDEIIFWNKMAENMLGWSKDESLGRKLHTLIVPEQYRAQAAKGFQHFTQTGEGPVINQVVELIAQRKDGTTFPVDLSVVAFVLNEQHYAHGLLRDATERKKAEERLRYLATTDELTKINNRRHFMEQAEAELKRHKRYRSELSLILFDIDHFKQINDTYGHDTGDMVLKKLTDTTLGVLREQDIFGRFGGEEFTIALPQTNLEGACQLAERIRQLIECTPFPITSERYLNVTVSLGVTTFAPDDNNLDTIIKRADIALYQAKAAGRNLVKLGTVLNSDRK